MNRRPCLCTKQWISGHVCVQKNPVGIELFSHVKTFFYPNQFAKLLITWRKTIYTLDLVGPCSYINGAFHSKKIPVGDFGNSKCPMEQYIRIPVAQTRDPSHRTFGYCSCKQDTEKRCWGQQFCQMERDISVRPTRNDQRRSKRTTGLESWSRIFRSDPTEMVRSIWLAPTEISGTLAWMESEQTQQNIYEEIRNALGQPGPLTRLAHLMIKPGPKRGRKSFV